MVTPDEPRVYWDEHHHVLANISTFPGNMMQTMMVFGGFWKLSFGNSPSKTYSTSQ